MRTRLGTAVLATALLAAAPALALDPATADAQAKEALATGPYSFCKRPPSPLPPRAHDLCGLAREIPDCEGFVKACEGAKPEVPKLGLGWLGELLGGIASVGIWLLVAAIVLALVVPIAQALMRARRDKKAADATPDAPADAKAEPAAEELATLGDAEQLLRRAEELAAQGRHDRAMFAFLQASLQALDERGAIRIERHRTHGEYVRSCREDPAKRPLRELVREIDRVKFGGARPDAASVSGARARAVALVRMLPVALLALLALFALGCGTQRALGGTDPSEDGLLVDLLKRQGADVSRLTSSLATMKPPAPGEVPAVVVVDAERVPLEDETRAHLLTWVEKGGVLVLVGAPHTWPKELGAKAISESAREVRAEQWFRSEADQDGDEQVPLVVRDPALLARGAALDWPDGDHPSVARFADGKLYAGIAARGEGRVLGVANDDLFTNAGLARPGNPRALVRMLANLHRTRFQIARPEDGITPPSNPISALVDAGLGKGLAHAAAAVLLLYLAFGTRLGRPRPTAPPARRAFAEHVEATGALYARTRVPAHALRAYARYADGRLRALMPRGASDPAAFLAARTQAPAETCARLWSRATHAAGDAEPRGDELTVLKDLSALVGRATRRD